VYETGTNSSGPRRPATLLEVNPWAACLIGVELGVDFVAVALTDFLSHVLWREQTQVQPRAGQSEILDQALRLVKLAMEASRNVDAPLFALGLTAPGTVDANEGVLIFAPNLQWRNVPLRKIFSEATGLRVFVENDANAAAIAEHLFGVARRSRDFIFVFAGVGIGGGLFLDGHLYRGKSGLAGEIGHLPIADWLGEESDFLCHCGNRGCWETYANQQAILRRMRSRLDGNQDGFLRQLMREHDVPLSIPLVKRAADLGDVASRAVFYEAGLAIGQGISGLVNIFNPEQVVVGGPLSLAGEYLLPAINAALEKHALLETRREAVVALSAFNVDASLIGAIAVIVEHILQRPSQVERR